MKLKLYHRLKRYFTIRNLRKVDIDKTKLTRASIETPISKKVVCTIVNHNHNENALRLKTTCAKYFDTIVLDSASPVKNDAFVLLDNVYYSGLFNYAYKFAKEYNYEYLFFICSDVEVADDQLEIMVNNLNNLDLNTIGIYSPSSGGRSHHYCKKQGTCGFRIVPFVEGFIFLADVKVLENIAPINLMANLYGWGLDVAKGFFAKKLNKLCIIDDAVTVYHKDGTGYSSEYADKDMWKWIRTFTNKDLVNFYKKHIDIIRRGLANENKISVIVPCYNQGEYIEETIYSLFNQEYSNYEIIVINDGSTDNSAAIVEKFCKNFPQIKLINKQNTGLGDTRNVGLQNATGDYIQFLDSDDLISTNKFLNQIYDFILHPTTGISYSSYICFEDRNPEKTWTYSRVKLKADPLFDLITQWEKELSIPVHCFLFRKEIIGETRFDITLPNHEDWEFHLSIAAKHPIYTFIKSTTAFYRIKETGMSQDPIRMKDGKNRCIANVIASNKIKEEDLIALYKRFDYKIMIGIITCEKNIEKINTIRETWAGELKKNNCPYYFIIGNPALKACKVVGDILYVPCEDNYESLTKKVSSFYKYIVENTSYDYVYKIDDDCFLNVELLHNTYFWNFNYFGKIVGTNEKDLNRTWHFGKCDTPLYNQTPYAAEYYGAWCGGGYGYFLSRNALDQIVLSTFTDMDIYEDKAIGDALRKKNILPELNDRYSTLDITRFNIENITPAAFDDLIDQNAHAVFTSTVMNEVSKREQFLQIQQKKIIRYS